LFLWADTIIILAILVYLSGLFSYRIKDLKIPHCLQYYSILIAVFFVLADSEGMVVVLAN